MEPEGSLPHSKVPATCPYPEPVRFTPCPTSHFMKIHLNIILPSTAWVSQVVFFPQVSPPKSCIRLSSSHTRYMPRPSHSFRFYHPNNIWWAVQIIKQYRSLSSSICSLLHSFIISSLLGPNIPLSNLFSNTLSFLSSLSVSDQVSHPYRTKGKIIVLCILVFKVFV